MNEIWFEKFDDYLQNKMKAGDKHEFEAQLASDKDMQEAFSLYKAIETDMRYLSSSEEETVALRSTLENLNDKYINSKATGSGKTRPFVPNKRNFFYAGIAAALVLIIVSYAIFIGSGPADLNQRATEYYASNLQVLSQTMSVPDSMQLAISAYNDKEYDLAQNYFEELLERNPSDAEVVKNLGVTHLAKEEYQQALNYFEQLAQRNELLNNPGLFLQALTFLIRNENGDREMAISKLKQVVATQSEKNEMAAEWLEELN